MHEGTKRPIVRCDGSHLSDSRHPYRGRDQKRPCRKGRVIRTKSVNTGPRVDLGSKRQQAAPRALSPLHVANPLYILNHMVQYTGTVLDASFAALSDATRRGVLEQLGRADASITDLAEKFHMTLTGMKKHVGVLEQAGLVTTEKVGRVRTCKLGLRGLEEEAAWIERYHQRWAARFDELDKLVEELKQKEKADVRKKR